MTVCFSFLSLLERPVAIPAEAPAKEQAPETAGFSLSSFDDAEARLPGPVSTFDDVRFPSPSSAVEVGKLDGPQHDLSDQEASTESGSETGPLFSPGSSRHW